MDGGEEELVTSDSGEGGGQSAVEDDVTLEDAEPFGGDGTKHGCRG